MSTANIYDLVLLILLVVVAFAYARKGFLAGLVQFLGNLASLVGAIVLSGRVAPLMFEKFFEGGFISSIEKTITQEGSVNIHALIEKYAGFLPSTLKENLLESASNMLNTTAPDIAVKLVNEIIAPLFTPIIAIVLFFVAFAVCKLIVSFLVAVLTNFNRIPLVGSVNKSLGFLMGVAAGLVDIYLVQCAVWAVIVITGGTIAFLNTEALSPSICYGLFSRWNPFF